MRDIDFDTLKRRTRANICMTETRKQLAIAAGKNEFIIKRFTLNKLIYENELDMLKFDEKKLIELDKKIYGFFGYSVKRTTNKPSNFAERTLHKQIFYRLGVEMEISAENLARYVGDKTNSWASASRRTIINNPKKLEVYRNFIRFVEEKQNN